MALLLADLVTDFADGLAAVDGTRVAHKTFQPGIGPFGEADAVRAIVSWLNETNPLRYGHALTKRSPDLLIPDEWAIELKVIRPFGDNGKPAEHWSQNVLHPYSGNTSSLGDCIKLLESGLSERKAVIIFGYEHSPAIIPLEIAVAGFELVAREILSIHLTPRIEKLRIGLIHPVHQQVRVYGYEVLRRFEVSRR